MTIKTGKEYIESLRKLKPVVYAFGKKVKSVVDYPVFKPHVNAAAMTYELANDPAYEDVMTVTSHLLGEKINRFSHIHQNIDDLVKKVKMMRLLGQRTSSCFQRCVGLDALNALYITTYDIDQRYKTNYHERFKEFLKYIQKNDLMSAGAMTDVKGDRSLRPHQQENSDMYVRVVDKRKDGIVARGSKFNITGTVNSHEIIVMPTRAMAEEDKDYAVSFAIPIDTKGVTLVFGRQPNDTRRLDGEIDAGNAKYAAVGGECMIILDNVFVPWERVFMCGEHDFSTELVETFAGFHRSNYGGCKVGIADVVIGASQLISEYHGIEKAPHIVDKLSEMIHMAETCWSCSLACSYEGFRTPSGAYSVNALLANIVKLNITRLIYEMVRLSQDLAGGAVVTLPSEKDYHHPRIGKYMDKYLKCKAGIPTEHRMRILRLIEAMSFGGYLTESLHGAGSPAAQKIMISRRGEIGKKKEFAEIISGIKEDKHFQRITGMKEDEYFAEFRKKRKRKE